MSIRKKIQKIQIAIIFLFSSANLMISQASAFDFENGNAAQVIIPAVVPAIYQSVSPTAGDATLVLRITTMITNSWFDAVAPYHPTAVGIYSDLGRRPASESSDNGNMNIAMFYASYRVLNSLLPSHAADWNNMMNSVGLDPNNDSEDTTTPQGIGNKAGNHIVMVREHDGMNQLGDEGGRTYNKIPYGDYLGFEPINSAYELSDPSHWQPAIVSKGIGLFQVQQFVTPQMRVTLPYSYPVNRRFPAPVPAASNIHNFVEYKQQADVVLNASANLTDEQKLKAELFDNKINSLGFSALFASQVNGLTLAEFVQYDFLTNMAAFDTAVAIWKEKYRYNAVRPFSAITFLYGDSPVTAWGGPGKGTVDDIPASSWKSYLDVADHPEYPSASASFCAAHAEASRMFLGSDNFGWTIPYPQGSSRIEPGLTPAADTTLHWDTWTDFEMDCGQSRFWAGVHFPASIPAGQDIGHKIAGIAYDFVMSHINGSTH